MTKKKYTKSQRKYIRNAKSSIRREFCDTKKQNEEIEKVFAKVDGKLHQHPKPKIKSEVKKGVAKKPVKSVKPVKDDNKTEKKPSIEEKPKENKSKK